MAGRRRCAMVGASSGIGGSVKSYPIGSDTACMRGADPAVMAGHGDVGAGETARPGTAPTAGEPQPVEVAPLADRLRREVVNPTQAAVPVVIGAYWVLHRYGFIAPIPFAALVAIVVGGQVASTATHVVFPRELGGWRLWCRVVVELGVIGANIYAIGWGPTLAVGLVFGAADNIRVSGSRATWPAVITAGATIAAGQLAFALGWARPMVDATAIQGLGLAALLGTAFTVALFGWSTRRAEEAEAATAASERWLRAIVAHQADVTVVVAPDARILWASPSIEEFAGVSATAAVGMDATRLLPSEMPGALVPVGDALRRQTGTPVRFEVRIRDRHGRWRWFNARATNLVDDPVVGGVVINLHDVTARRELEADLRHRAFHDELTGLPNRRAFFEHLDRVTRRVAAGLGRVAVLFCDLDRFKVVNDGLGHEVGDELLRGVADRLREGLRPTDFVARLGGDEFTVVVTDVREPDEAVRVARRVIRLIEQPFPVAGTEVRISASVGIAVSEPGRADPRSLLRHADLGMYEAKRDGAATVELYDPDRGPAGAERLRLEVDLQAALDDGGLEVHFQPEIRIGDGHLVGLEALARWAHPELGMLDAHRFVPIAEEAGIVARLDEVILDLVAAQIATWRAARLSVPEVAVNLSPHLLRREDGAATVLAVLHRHGVSPSGVAVEITQRLPLGDRHRVEQVQRLRAAGCRVVIDDFGTGAAGLEHLRRLPVDRIKLDRSYVAELVTDPADAAIVEAVIGMSHAIGVEVTAEGVERPEELDALGRLGCDRVQGRLLAPPLDAEAATVFLRRPQPMPSSRSRRRSRAPKTTATPAVSHTAAPTSQVVQVAPNMDDEPTA